MISSFIPNFLIFFWSVPFGFVAWEKHVKTTPDRWIDPDVFEGDDVDGRINDVKQDR